MSFGFCEFDGRVEREERLRVSREGSLGINIVCKVWLDF